MTSLVHSTYLYVSSANAPGDDNGDFVLQVPEDSIRCKSSEYIKLTLVHHSMVNSLYNVTPGNQAVTRVTGGVTTRFVLPPGSYRLNDLQDAFNTFDMGVAIDYLDKQNQWKFTSTLPNVVTLTFEGTLAYLFGQRPGYGTATIAAMGNTSSAYPIVPRFINDIVIKIGGVMVGPPVNISNTESTELSTSTILGIVPLRAAPGQLSVFQNVNDTFQAQIFDTDVQRLAFQVTDITGKAIPGLPDWTAVLKIDVHKRLGDDPVTAKLDAILEFVRLSFMQLAVDRVDPDGEDTAVAQDLMQGS